MVYNPKAVTTKDAVIQIEFRDYILCFMFVKLIVQ